jgi:hypothetical protein
VADARARDAGRKPGLTAVHWWLGHGLGLILVRWWRRRGLRARLTLTAALGLIVAFAAADLLLFNALRGSLTRSVDDSARSGAVEVQALINAKRGLPNPVPVPSDITIQVLNSAGVITNVSSEADRLVPIVSLARARALADGGARCRYAARPLTCRRWCGSWRCPRTAGSW